MHSLFVRRPTALLIALAAMALPLAPIAARADGDDPNGVGVARISLIDGSVAVQRGDTSTPVDAAVNAPVLAADYVTTGDGSHAEVQFDGTSTVRLGDNVQMRFTRIDAGNRSCSSRKARSSCACCAERRRERHRHAVDLDPSARRRQLSRHRRSRRAHAAHRALRPRRDRDAARQSSRRVGRRAARAGTGVQSVRASRRGRRGRRFRQLQPRPRPVRAARPRAEHRVSPGMQGVADLDANGRWVADNSYGQVWVPRTSAPTGRRIATAVGSGKTTTAGPGSAPNRGAGRRITTVAGITARRTAGRGIPVRGWRVAVWQPALVAFIGFGGGGGREPRLRQHRLGSARSVRAVPPWWGRGYNSTTIVVNNYNGGERYRNALYNGATYVDHQRFLEGRFDHRVRDDGRTGPSGTSRPRSRAGRSLAGKPALHRSSGAPRTSRCARPSRSARSPVTPASCSARRSSSSARRSPAECVRRAAEPSRGSAPPGCTPYGGRARRRLVAFRHAARPTHNVTTTPGGTTRSGYGTDRPSYTTAAPRLGRQTVRGTVQHYQRPGYSQPSGTYQRPGYSQPREPTSGRATAKPSDTYSAAGVQPTSGTYQRPGYNQRREHTSGPATAKPSDTYQRPGYSQGSGTVPAAGYSQRSGNYQRPGYSQPAGQPTSGRRTTKRAYPQHGVRPAGADYQRQQPSTPPARTQQGSRRLAAPEEQR